MLKDIVTYACLAYAAVLLITFWFMANAQAKATKDAKQVVSVAAARSSTDSVTDVIEKAAKLVEALTKAGPAIAALGASVVALGFAAYIVAEPAKEQDKTKSDTQQSQAVPKKT